MLPLHVSFLPIKLPLAKCSEMLYGAKMYAKTTLHAHMVWYNKSFSTYFHPVKYFPFRMVLACY